MCPVFLQKVCFLSTLEDYNQLWTQNQFSAQDSVKVYVDALTGISLVIFSLGLY